MLNGSYTLSIFLPGGARDCTLHAERNGKTLQGYLTNPYDSAQQCALYDGLAEEDCLRFKTRVGDVEYVFDGTAADRELTLHLHTYQTIQLEPGIRLKGKPGALDGEYLVGIYSPGGVKENHMVLETTANGVAGEMFCLSNPDEGPGGPGGMPVGPGGMPGSPGEMPGGPGGMPVGPGGMPGGPGGMPMPQESPDGKRDRNEFKSGFGTAAGFEVTTVTGQGSEFKFSGRIDGDRIYLTMRVVDTRDNLRAVYQA